MGPSPLESQRLFDRDHGRPRKRAPRQSPIRLRERHPLTKPPALVTTRRGHVPRPCPWTVEMPFQMRQVRRGGVNKSARIFLWFYFFLFYHGERERKRKCLEQLAYVCTSISFGLWCRPSSVLLMPSAMIMSCGRTFRFCVRFLTTQ